MLRWWKRRCRQRNAPNKRDEGGELSRHVCNFRPWRGRPSPEGRAQRQDQARNTLRCSTNLPESLSIRLPSATLQTSKSTRCGRIMANFGQIRCTLSCAGASSAKFILWQVWQNPPQFWQHRPKIGRLRPMLGETWRTSNHISVDIETRVLDSGTNTGPATLAPFALRWRWP